MNSGFGLGAAPLTAGVSGAVVTSELPAGVLGFFFITCRQRSQRKRVIVERQMLAISLIDRIALASSREEIVRRREKDNQGARTDLLAKLPKGEPVHPRREIARAADVGGRTYDVTSGNLSSAARLVSLSM